MILAVMQSTLCALCCDTALEAAEGDGARLVLGYK